MTPEKSKKSHKLFENALSVNNPALFNSLGPPLRSTTCHRCGLFGKQVCFWCPQGALYIWGVFSYGEHELCTVSWKCWWFRWCQVPIAHPQRWQLLFAASYRSRFLTYSPHWWFKQRWQVLKCRDIHLIKQRMFLSPQKLLSHPLHPSTPEAVMSPEGLQHHRPACMLYFIRNGYQIICRIHQLFVFVEK